MSGISTQGDVATSKIHLNLLIKCQCPYLLNPFYFKAPLQKEGEKIHCNGVLKYNDH